MKKFLIKSAATLTLGILLATNPFVGVSAEGENGDIWNQLGGTAVNEQPVEYVSEATSGAPCSTGQGVVMTDCIAEYTTSDGTLLSWKTGVPANSQFQVRNERGIIIASNNGMQDGTPATYTRSHTVAIDRNANFGYNLTAGTTYDMRAVSGAPNGNGGTSDSIRVRLKAAEVSAPSTDIDPNTIQRSQGIVSVPVTVTGAYKDVALYYALKNSSGRRYTGYRQIGRQAAVGNTVTFQWDTNDLANGTYAIMAAAQNDARLSGGWAERTVTIQNPAITACSGNGPCNVTVVNAASNDLDTNAEKAYAPGSMLAIYGERLAPTWATATSLPLPQSLGETRVLFTLDGAVVPGYLSFVSPYQINVQVPFDAITGQRMTGTVQVVTPQGRSIPVPVIIRPNAPGIFTNAGNNTGANSRPVAYILHASSGPDASRVEPVTEQSDGERAHVGEYVMLYMTGAGLPKGTTTYAAGDSVPSPWPRTQVEQFDVFIGTVKLSDNATRYAFKTPLTTGIDQINIRIPALPNGLYEIKVCTTGGAYCSNVGSIPVTNTRARHPNAIQYDSFVTSTSPSQSTALLPSSNGEIAVSEGSPLPTPVPTEEPLPWPTPYPTDGCGNEAWGSDCLPPIEMLSTIEPSVTIFPEPLATTEPVGSAQQWTDSSTLNPIWSGSSTEEDPWGW